MKIEKTGAKYKDWSGVEFAKYGFQFGEQAGLTQGGVLLLQIRP